MKDSYLPWTEFSAAGQFVVRVNDSGVAVSSSTELEEMPDAVARKLLDALTRYFADKDNL